MEKVGKQFSRNSPVLVCQFVQASDNVLKYEICSLLIISQSHFQIGEGDELLIKDVKITSQHHSKTPLERGNTIKFQSGHLSDGQTKFKIWIKKVGEEYPQVDPNGCKPFYFEWDEGSVEPETDRKIPRRMMDEIGPTTDDSGKKFPRIFRYAGPNTIPGTVGEPSAYVNEGLIIQQRKARSTAFNYFAIG